MVYQAERLVWKVLGDDFELYCIYGCVSWCDKLKLMNMLLKANVISFSLFCEQWKMVDLDILLKDVDASSLWIFSIFSYIYIYYIY